VIEESGVVFFARMNFLAGYSTQDGLLHVSDSWFRAVDIGQYVGAIFWTWLSPLIV